MVYKLYTIGMPFSSFSTLKLHAHICKLVLLICGTWCFTIQICDYFSTLQAEVLSKSATWLIVIITLVFKDQRRMDMPVVLRINFVLLKSIFACVRPYPFFASYVSSSNDLIYADWAMQRCWQDRYLRRCAYPILICLEVLRILMNIPRNACSIFRRAFVRHFLSANRQ